MREGVRWGCFLCGKETQFGCGAVWSERETRAAAEQSARRRAHTSTHTHSLSLSLPHTNWEKAASFLRPDKHSHSLTGAHTQEATGICGYMQQIYHRRAPRFDCVSKSFPKEGQLTRVFIHLFIYFSFCGVFLRTLSSSGGFNMPDF